MEMCTPSKERVAWRRKFGEQERKAFNTAVWDRILHLKKVNSKSKSFTFHHEITTDGISVSLLYSKPLHLKPEPEPVPHKMRANVILYEQAAEEAATAADEKEMQQIYPSREVGLDPGKRNILTMTDKEGISIRYTARQKQFESGLTRYLRVLEKEKRKWGITSIEATLSRQLSRRNDSLEYKGYLLAAAACEDKMNTFYRQERWRGWKFRLYCRGRSSQDRLMNRISDTYGPYCHIYYGNWSRRSQMPQRPT